MRTTHNAFTLCLTIVFGGLASGCAASMAAVTCLPGEPSVNCCIKKFPLTPLESCGVSAAEALNLLHAMEMAGQITAADAAAEQDEVLEGSEDSASPAAPEPPDCKGQEHHVISRPIARALEEHDTLSGLYEPRDPRFVTKAKDEKSHCGYQQWHREVDREVIQWLLRHRKATKEQFEAYLREIYSRSGLRERFPHGF